MQRAYDPLYGDARVPPPRPQAAQPRAVPRDPPPPIPPVPPTPPAGDPMHEAAIPDWLGERLREDAAREERAQWSSLWKRRLATWSMAGGLLAIVAAGGLWVYEDSRVDGALGVVAQTSPEQPAPPPVHALTPAPVAEAAPPSAALLPAPSPAPDPAPLPSPASPSVPESAPVVPAQAAIAPAEPPLPAAAGAAAAFTAGAAAARSDADASAAARAAQATESRSAARGERKAQSARRNAARRQVAQADKPRRPAPAPVPAEPSPRQRREETLMQCRAHGYDQRQCDRRGCTMTPYGFACRG